MVKRVCLFLLMMSFFFALVVVGQKQRTPKLPSNKWEELVKDEAFDYENQENEELTIAPQQRKSLSMSPELANFLKYGITTVVVVLLGFLIFKMVEHLQSTKKNPRLDAKSLATSIEEAEQNLADTDLSELLSKAEANKDFKMALRVRFLLLLQVLTTQGHIRHRKDKTNQEYYHEIAPSSLKAAYLKAAQYFERYWFGQTILEEQQYSAATNHFTSLTHNLLANEQ